MPGKRGNPVEQRMHTPQTNGACSANKCTTLSESANPHAQATHAQTDAARTGPLMLTWVCLGPNVWSYCQRLACGIHLTIICAILAIACGQMQAGDRQQSGRQQQSGARQQTGN